MRRGEPRPPPPNVEPRPHAEGKPCRPAGWLLAARVQAVVRAAVRACPLLRPLAATRSVVTTRRQRRATASGAWTKASPSTLTTAHGQHPSAMASASVTATQDRHVCAVQSAWSTTGTPAAAGPHPPPPRCPPWWSNRPRRLAARVR